MNHKEFHQLRMFCSGYFHEDWELEFSHPDEVVADYLKSDPSKVEVDQIVTQILAYLEKFVAIELADRYLLDELGCYYSPAADGISAKDWLLRLANLLRSTETVTLNADSKTQSFARRDSEKPD